MQRPSKCVHPPTLPRRLLECHIRRESEGVDRSGCAVVAVLALVEHFQFRALTELEVRARPEAVSKPLLVLEFVEALIIREQVRHPAQSLGGPTVLETDARAVGVARGVDGIVESEPDSQRVAPEAPGALAHEQSDLADLDALPINGLRFALGSGVVPITNGYRPISRFVVEIQPR